MQRFRLLLWAAAAMYPLWAFVLAYVAPDSLSGLPGRGIVSIMCVAIVIGSHLLATVRRHIERYAFVVAVTINTHNAMLFQINNAGVFYLIGYILCVFGLAMAFESQRLLISYLVIATATACLVEMPMPQFNHGLMISSTAVTMLMAMLCFFDKLRVVDALKQRNRDHQVVRFMLNETQRLAKLGGWSYKPNSGTLWWSEQTYAIHDVPLNSKLKLEHAFSFYAGEARQRLQEHISAAVAAGTPFDLELPLTTALGRQIWVRMTCIVEHEPRGKRLIGSIRDLTKEHELKAELVAREASARAVIDAIPGMVAWIDDDLSYLGVNRNLARNYEKEIGSFLGKKLGFRQDVGADDLSKFGRELFASSADSLTREICVGVGNNKSCVYLISAQKYRNNKEAVLIAIDIDERHRAQRELSEQKELLAELLDHLPLGVHAKDATDFHYVIWNRAMEQLAGVTRAQIIGQTDAALYPPQEAERQQQIDRQVIDAKELLIIEDETLVMPGGTFPAHTVRVPVFRDDGRPLMVLNVVENIAEKKQREDLIHTQQVQLMHASKMSTLGEMSGGIAHEINNPLTVIAGFAQRMVAVLQPDEYGIIPAYSPGELKRYADRINNMCDRIAKIVRGLRTFAREASNDPCARLPVRSIISDTLELCEQRFINNGIKLEVSEIDDLLCLECRSVQISQVLVNLLNNAFDAVREHSAPWVHLIIEDHDEFISFSVIDSGPGIPDQVAEKLMQPFFTTKAVGQGTGLGLSISRGIIDSHGGSLQLDRSYPHTRFVFVLPKVQAPKSQPKLAA